MLNMMENVYFIHPNTKGTGLNLRSFGQAKEGKV